MKVSVGVMARRILVLMWVMLGGWVPWAGAQPETGMWVTLESVDGRALYVELLKFGDREVQVRTANKEVLRIKYELLSQTSQAVLEQLDGSEAWLARRFPMAWKVRSDQAMREDRIATLGGEVKSEEAVLNALRWLKKTQSVDGSWGPKKVAYTGLALQCFSGRGFSPLSEEFGECYTAGLTYLANISMKNKGRMADNLADKHWPYEHAIATEAVVEGFMICKLLGINFPNLEQAAQNGVQWIIDNQHKSGGWDYSYDETGARGGDLSISSWHINALHAARVAKIEARNMKVCMAKARQYVAARQASNGGFGYQGKTPVGSSNGHFTLTGAGVRALQICDLAKGVSASSKEERKGIRHLVKEAKFDWENGPANLYELYHNCRALARRGGDAWQACQKQWRDELVAHQSEDGSWSKPAKPGIGNSGDAIYNTCLATLILESYYR